LCVTRSKITARKLGSDIVTQPARDIKLPTFTAFKGQSSTMKDTLSKEIEKKKVFDHDTLFSSQTDCTEL
jgi:hypothetical protein